MQVHDRWETSCNRMKSYLASESHLQLSELATSMICWAGMRIDTKLELLNEWSQVASFVQANTDDERDDNNNMRTRKKNFWIPGTDHAICRNALCGLLCVGKDLLKTALKSHGERARVLREKKET